MPTYTKRTTGPRPRSKLHPRKSKHSAALSVAHRDDWLDGLSLPEAIENTNPVLTPEQAREIKPLPDLKPAPTGKPSFGRVNGEAHWREPEYHPPTHPDNRKIAHYKAQYAQERKPVKKSDDDDIILFSFKPKAPKVVNAKGKPIHRFDPLEPTNPPTFGKKVK